MSGLMRFDSFSQILQHCFELEKEGQTPAADALLCDFIGEAEKRLREEKLWTAHNLEQAESFRICFAENQLAVEMAVLRRDEKALRDKAYSLAESYSRLAIAHFEQTKDLAAAHHFAKEALRYAAMIEFMSPTLLKAASYAHQFPFPEQSTEYDEEKD